MAAQITPVVIATLLERDAGKVSVVVDRIEAGGCYERVTATPLIDPSGLNAGVMIQGEPSDQAIHAARSEGTLFQRNP